MNQLTRHDEGEVTLHEVIHGMQFIIKSITARAHFIAKLTAVFALCGIIVALASPTEYKSSLRLIPYRTIPSTGALSGLAGLAGIRLPAGSAEQFITTDLYPEIVKSFDYKMAVAETPILFSSSARKLSAIEYFSKVYKPSMRQRIASMPRRIWGSMNIRSHLPQDIRSVSVQDSVSLITNFSESYIENVEGVSGRISLSIDKKTSVITISAMMPDAFAAASLAQVAAEQLMKRITSFESRKSSEQYVFIESQFRQAKLRYELAQTRLAVYSDRNRVQSSAASQVERIRLQREYDLSFELYQQLSRDLEQSKIRMNMDIPVFATLEAPSVPNQRYSPRRFRVTVFAAFAGIFTSIMFVAIRLLYDRVLAIKYKE